MMAWPPRQRRSPARPRDGVAQAGAVGSVRRPTLLAGQKSQRRESWEGSEPAASSGFGEPGALIPGQAVLTGGGYLSYNPNEKPRSRNRRREPKRAGG
jgi:hypothetical protein